jgi:hypothetical protein
MIYENFDKMIQGRVPCEGDNIGNRQIVPGVLSSLVSWDLWLTSGKNGRYVLA